MESTAIYKILIDIVENPFAVAHYRALAEAYRGLGLLAEAEAYLEVVGDIKGEPDGPRPGGE